MRRPLRRAASFAACASLVGVALRIAQWRVYHFDIVSGESWQGLWRGFVAGEIIFDTPLKCAFLIAFPLAGVAALLLVAPIAAMVERMEMPRGRPRPVAPVEAKPSTEAPLDLHQIEETADELYRKIFARGPARLGGTAEQDLGQTL